MESGGFTTLNEPESAERAARQAIDTDPDDWRGYVSLARALVGQKRAPDAITIQKRVKEAVVAARKAVALAPEEPEAHLALADALLAVFPRKVKNRATARAHVDQAELLGVDPRDLAERRAQPKPLSLYVTYWSCWWLFWIFGVQHQEGVIGMAIAWPAMIIALAGMIVALLRPTGQSLRETLEVKRKLSRKRLATDDLVLQRAPGAAAVFAFVALPSAFLAIPGADDSHPALPLAWTLLCGVPLAFAATWIGVDRWLRPGTVIRTLRHDPFVASSVPITLILATITAVSAIRGVNSSGLWSALFLGQMAWITGNVILAAKLVSRRKKAP